MQPVTILTLLVYVPAFLLMLALYGNPFRIVFEKYLVKRDINLDRVEKVSLTLASGSAVIPLIIMIFTLLRGLLSTFTVQFLTLVFTVINFVVYRKSIGRLGKAKIALPNAKTTIVLVVFLAIFIFHLYSSLGLFVYPGNDPALYSMITLRIVENGGYAQSWGSFAPPTWYMEKIHLIIAGFAGTCSYFHFLTGLSVEKAVFLITIIYASLISLGIYFLLKRLLKNTSFALCSAFTLGMLIEPGIGWFTWGGNAELASLFLLLVAIGILWELFSRDSINLGYLLYVAFLVAGMVLYHSLAAFYLAFFLIAYIVVYIRRAPRSILKIIIVAFLSIAFILPIFISAVTSEMAIAKEYAEAPNPFWTPTIQWDPMVRWYLSARQNVFSIIWRFLSVYGAGTFLLMIAIKVLQNYKYDKKFSYLLLAWWIVIFLAHENNPNGLFLIRFPLWYRIAGETNRVFTETSFPVAIVIGIGTAKVFENLRKIHFRKSKVFSSLRSMLKTVLSEKLMLVVIFLFIFQVSINISINSYARSNSPITEADISAFNWIKQNTSPNDVFFVMHNDAGFWIPVYTHRRVVIPFGVVTNATLLNYYKNEIAKTSIEDLSSYEVLSLLNQQDVSYVYVGSKKVLQDIFPMNINPGLLAHSPFFETVYNESNTYIFNFHGATFNTIWVDYNFSSGWTVNQGTGNTVDEMYELRPSLRLGDKEPRGVASREVQLDNVQNVTFLEVHWNTTKTATFSVYVEVDGVGYEMFKGQNPQKELETTIINVNSKAVGRINRISIVVEGDGYGYVDDIKFIHAIPLREGD